MLSGIKALTLVRDTKHLTVNGNKVKVYVVPEIPVDLTPVWILVHAEGYQEGNYNLTINVDKPGNITVIIVHPWSGKVNITVIGESVKEVNISKHINITQVDVYVERSGSITMYLTSDPTSTFDQAYVYALTIEAEEATTTVTTIVTTSVTTTTTVTTPITVPTTITKTETKMIKETETTTLTKTRTRTHYIART